MISELPEDDEDNPWRWIATAKVGQPSEVVVAFGVLGFFKADGVYALLDDGYWYHLYPAARVPSPVAWRYASASAVAKAEARSNKRRRARG